jgi:serine/threonine protein kinase
MFFFYIQLLTAIYFYHRTLHDLLSKETGLKGRFMMAKQIVEGVCFIHANEFVHRDLATKNIFVGASQAQDEKEIKIGDFGIGERFKLKCF